jgi:hypothetical protein
MSDEKQRPRRVGKKGKIPAGPGDPATGGEPVDVTWDQKQERYPAPERPRDRAEDTTADDAGE